MKTTTCHFRSRSALLCAVAATAAITTHCYTSSTTDQLNLSGSSASVAPSNIIGSGQSLVTVSLQGADGTPITGSIVQVSVDGCDVTQPTSPTRSDGTAQASILSCGQAGQHRITVEVTSGARQLPVAVAAAVKSVTPATLDGHDVQAGFPLNTQMVATRSDGARDVHYAGTVHFSSSDPEAELPADFTFTGKENGVKVLVDAVIFRSAGLQTISAVDTATGQKLLSETYTITPGPAGVLSISQRPDSAQAGVPFQVVVTATDSTGAVLPGYTGSVKFVSSDPAAVLPDAAPFLPGDAGQKTFTLALKTAGAQTFQATDGSIASVSQSISVQAGAAAKLRVIAPPQFVAGAAQPVTVQSMDSYGNVVPTYSGTVHFSSSDPNLNLTSSDPNVRSLPMDTVFDSAGKGTMIFPRVALVTAGSQSLTVTDTQDPNFAYTQQGIKVVGGSAINWKLSTNGNAWVAGQPFSVTVTALDTYNNPASLYRGLIKFTASDPNAILPANYTFNANDMGVKTYPNGVMWAHSGNQNVAIADFVAHRGSTVSGLVVPNKVSGFTLSGYANPAYVANSGNVIVSPTDAWGNINPSFAGAVHFSSTDANATLPGDITFTSGQGTLSSMGTVVYAHYGAQQLIATSVQDSNLVGNANVAVHQIQKLVANDSLSTCAIVDSGQLRCWGQNTGATNDCTYCSGGQLGMGDTNDRGVDPQSMGPYLPNVDLGKGRSVVKIAGGTSHRCALLDNHTVKCWGDNHVSELGMGDANSRGNNPNTMGDALPTVFLGTQRTAANIWADRSATCVKTDDGQVRCWGYNPDGELGLGDPNDRGSTPQSMQLLPTLNVGTGRSIVSMGIGSYHTCAVLDDGSVKCWGFNGQGELGLGDTLSRGNASGQMGDNLPTVDLGSNRTALSVGAGRYHTCALLDNHKVKCWGYGNDGCLGYEDPNNRGVAPGQMGDDLPYVNLSSNPNRTVIYMTSALVHNCAVFDDGSVKCWGQNSDGRCGTGDAISYGPTAGSMGDNLPAVAFPAGRTLLQIALGAYHTCARLSDGLAYCWGDNQQGQMGLASGLAGNIGIQPQDMGNGLQSVHLW